MYDAVVFIDIHYFVLLMRKLHTLHIWFLGYVPVWRCGTLRIVLSSYKIEKWDEDKSNFEGRFTVFSWKWVYRALALLLLFIILLANV